MPRKWPKKVIFRKISEFILKFLKTYFWSKSCKFFANMVNKLFSLIFSASNNLQKQNLLLKH